MRKVILTMMVAAMTVVVGVLGTGRAYAAPMPPPQAKGMLKTADGTPIGAVLLTQMKDGTVFVSSDVKGLPAGDHGFTMREKGACTPNFDAAGKAFNSDLKITVKPDGFGVLEKFVDVVTVTPSAKTVLDADGTAIVITANGDENAKVACAVLEPVAVPAPIAPNASSASAEFKSVFGESLGNATFTQNADGSVRVQGSVHGLPAGVHAMHVHQFGMCTPTFGAAGEHHNPLDMMHGTMAPMGPHPGDLPNITVGADGTATFDVTTRMFTLSASDTTILDSDGSALMIHALPDDEMSQPGGNADGRIACAVIQANAASTMPAPAPAQPVPAQPVPAQPAQPAQLPNTGGADLPWQALLIVGFLALAGGALALRGARR